MSNDRDSEGELLSDAERLTPLGRALRATSIDELPELWSVLRGDMSLVGPRPLLIRYTAFMTDEERARMSVRPGITGWAQIHGRNDTPWDERLARDVWYVQNWTFALDLRILARTILGVLRGDGVVVDPSSTMLNLDDERRP
jgi:lipopolysaccharide/colanic/teichoic acid biosynthesis glycosyltransferase